MLFYGIATAEKTIKKEIAPPDGSVTGAGVTLGPSLPGSFIFGYGGGSYTWTLGCGKW